MTDFKLGDGLIGSVAYDPPITFTTPGTTAEVVPAGVTVVQVKIWGAAGGGGGGGRGVANATGGDGGGGGFIWTNDIPVVPGDSIEVIVAGGGGGGIGGTVSGIPGDGGAGGGRSQVSNTTTVVDLATGGAGAGGGGGAGGVFEPTGAQTGGGGGGSTGGTRSEGGGGGSQSAGGLGGPGELVGEDGVADIGGDGGDGSGSPAGANATGGVPGGGDGGAYDTDFAGGGGGGAGLFGGGGGGSGETFGGVHGNGGPGGGSANVHPGTFRSSVQASDISAAGASDPDYPGSVGNGGLGGIPLSVDNGGAGESGAVVLIFGRGSVQQTRNDLVIENDAPVLVEGIDLIAQHVRTILLICQGEWFLDLAAGTPWFQRIIGHKFNAGQINITVRDAILSVDGVASIVDIVSVRGAQPRSADIKVKVLTTQGAEVIIEAEVP